MLQLLSLSSLAAVDWRMLDAYCKFASPPHYVTRKLGATESIVVDGKLDEPAWAEAEWTAPMVDITRHENQAQNAVPNDVQCRVKVRWDDDYLYIGAELAEPFAMTRIQNMR